MPEAVTDKGQAYPSSKNMTDVQGYVAIWGSGRTFIPHQAQCIPLYLLVKKGTVWKWGSRQQAAFKKHNATEAGESVVPPKPGHP